VPVASRTRLKGVDIVVYSGSIPPLKAMVDVSDTKSASAIDKKLQVNVGAVHVATYQFPVGLGDCSVHLLVDEKDEVVSGFLMDGGKDAPDVLAAGVIYDGLRMLKAAYGDGWTPLRAWAVTHWDEDHYQGMANFIIDNPDAKTFFTQDVRLYAGQKVKDEMPDLVAKALQKFNVVEENQVSYFCFT
jgi:glyoxylase-like metal-dependent hydrolase (beta-lactamase superfamily II)